MTTVTYKFYIRINVYLYIELNKLYFIIVITIKYTLFTLYLFFLCNAKLSNEYIYIQ